MLKARLHTASGRASLLPQILSEKLTKKYYTWRNKYTNFSHTYDLRSYLFTIILSSASQELCCYVI